MKNSNLKGALGAVAIVGLAIAVKKISQKRKFMKAIFEEYDIQEKTPFGFADKIREMDDEKYAELKSKMKEKFASKCCKSACRTQKTEA